MGHSVSSLTMLQTITLSVLATVCVCVPAPEADPLLFTGHPLTYSVPYVTYHKTECNTEVEEVKGQECVTKPVTKCNDIEVPSHRIKVDNVARTSPLPAVLRPLTSSRERLMLRLTPS